MDAARDAVGLEVAADGEATAEESTGFAGIIGRHPRMQVIFDVIRRVRFLEAILRTSRPLFVPWRDLRGGIETFVAIGTHGLAQQVLAAAIAVDVRCVEKATAPVHGRLQGLERLMVV